MLKNKYLKVSILPIFIGVFAMFMMGSCNLGNKTETEKLNIVWIFAEDVSPMYSCYGNTVIKTPNVDFMAENGVLFSNVHASAPVCSPSRSSIVTGMMQTTIGAHHHHSARTVESQNFLPDSIKTIPEIFREAGYYTFNNGKDDYNFSYDRKKMYSGKFHAYFWYTLKGEGHWRDAEREEGQPFFAQFQLEGDKYTLSQPDRIPKYHKRIKEEDRVKPEDVIVPPFYPDTLPIRERLAKHYDAVQMVDQDVERIVGELKEDNLLENTIVILLSDHGNESLRYKQFLYDGGTHIPLIISYFGNNPKIKELIKPGTVRDDMVSGIDIAATTLALVGFEVPKVMEGKNVFDPGFHRDYVITARDRCDFTVDRIRAVRDKQFKYIKNFYPERSYSQPQYRETRMEYVLAKEMYEKGLLTEAQAMYWKPTRPAEELYDVVNDPNEINNLAQDSTYAETLAKMRNILEEWIVASDDKGQYAENPEDLRFIFHCWLDRCTDPVFDAVKKRPMPLTPPWLIDLYGYESKQINF